MKNSGQALRNSGQAVLLVLVVVAVALAFGLSIIAQSNTELKISFQDQEAARAFNAAEAGIEEALKNIAVGDYSLNVDDLNVNYSVASQSTLEGVFAENESAQVSLSGASGGLTQLTVEWVDSDSSLENPGSCLNQSGGAPASLEITLTDSANQIRRLGYNACDLSAENNLTNVTDSGSGNYLRQVSFAVDGGTDILVRIRPLYNQTSLRIFGNVDLPTQAYKIDSEAQAPTLEARAIKVTRTEPATPAIFDYVLFSGSSISK